MTDLEMLTKILDNQDPKLVKNGQWDAVQYSTEEEPRGKNIHIDSDKVGFCFDKEGRFQGIFNWK